MGCVCTGRPSSVICLRFDGDDDEADASDMVVLDVDGAPSDGVAVVGLVLFGPDESAAVVVVVVEEGGVLVWRSASW